MKKMDVPLARRPGRPLGFDREAALQQAMLLFWRHGYEATSVNDLVQTMGITPPSLYTAFGDKKQLFLEAVRHYLSGPITSQSIIQDALTAQDAAHGLLQTSAMAFAGNGTPPGCLLASSAISCSPAAADVQRALAEIRTSIGTRLRDKIKRDQTLRKLRPAVDADALAGHTMAVIQGMSTLARDGANLEKLRSIATTAMLVWPSQSSGAQGRAAKS